MSLALIGLVAVFAIYLIGQYNGFIVLKTRIQEALSGIDVQLKRRADLIPNLVETVKGYAKHEKSVFAEVTKARSSLMNAGTLGEKAKADNMLTGALKSLFAVAEAYPELKASTNFQDLQRQLEDTEDKVAYSRQFYNANVLDFNNKAQMFPTNIIANVFGFKLFEFFAATEEERKKISVNF
ncbi:MAG: LemA family protein [Candidatus Roizmanbacteria bacterium GW2011_GWA2_35_19]|uniref:LemA family protein n=2 Tax=Candidatus Roizmaniibacteriota TaxID=1752723 RepID=A0A0G0BVX8_9BACT|nr:MAG: LemA family protein [Candidatus Roizmanbacteria bacterium GW2011_GWC2_35_12]KKP73458.1 MAG: LemA family protein [Candidatus Roizmanbacteria bacterium GW2011_GWA2_35_19]